MAQKDYTILNKLGIHARPAAQFVKTANRFQSDIMMLAAGNGSIISISADGADADAALEALGDLITRKFEEE